METKDVKRNQDLHIDVDSLTEQCFYIKMALKGRISDEAGEKNWNNIKGKYPKEVYLTAFNKADKMIANLDKYGVACAAWI